MNEGSRRGARGGLWGLLPSSVSGKRVGTDDHLTPSFSSSGCSAPGAASLPGGGLGAAALSLSPERKHLLSVHLRLLSPGAGPAQGTMSVCCYCCCCQVASVMSDSVQPHRWQPPGSSIPGTLQARMLEWVAISFSSACTHAC